MGDIRINGFPKEQAAFARVSGMNFSFNFYIPSKYVQSLLGCLCHVPLSAYFITQLLATLIKFLRCKLFIR